MTRAPQPNSSQKSPSSRQNPQPRSRYTPEHKILLSILVEARHQAGISQAALAEQLGKVQSHVAYIETGDRDITGVEIYKWCEAVGLPFVEFARRMDEQIQEHRRNNPEPTS